MKEKVLKLPKAVIVILGIILMAGFLGVMNLSSLLFVWVLPNEGYLLQMASELAGTVYIVIVLAVLGYLGVFKEKGDGFLRGFYTAGFMIGYCGYVFVAQLYVKSMGGEGELQSFGWILVFALTMFLVGLNEELVMRGAVLHLFLDKFQKTKAGVLLSIILSSAIFGAAHLFNIVSGVSVMSAVSQAAQATLLGILFAAIYLRCGNLWITIIAHAVMDFAALVPSGLFGIGDLIDGINQISWLNFVVTLPLFLIPSVILLRPSKLEEIVRRQAGEEIKMSEKDVHQASVMSLVLGIIGLFVGFSGYGIGIALAGLFAGIVSLKEQREKNGMAAAGLILSIMGIIISIPMIGIMYYLMPSVGAGTF